MKKRNKDTNKLQQKEEQEREIWLDCQHREAEKLNIDIPTEVDNYLVVIQKLMHQLINHNEKLKIR